MFTQDDNNGTENQKAVILKDGAEGWQGIF